MTRTAQELLPVDSRPQFRRFAILWVLITTEFTVVYYGADWITAHHALRIHAYVRSELRIPLVPVMVVPYMTMYLIFLFTPFVLRRPDDLDRFAGALGQVIAIAGIAFLLVPAQLGFDPMGMAGGIWEPWLQLATTLSRTNNLVPSLHVALFTVAAATFATRVSIPVRVFLGIWLLVVAASTLLTHQHHLVDVVTGLILGGWGARLATSRSLAPPAQGAISSLLGHESSACSR